MKYPKNQCDWDSINGGRICKVPATVSQSARMPGLGTQDDAFRFCQPHADRLKAQGYRGFRQLRPEEIASA